MEALVRLLDSYTELIESFIQHQSVLAPLLLLFVEEAGVPILVPGDGILAYTGYSVQISQHSSIWIAFAAAVLAVVAGSSILFFISRHYGQQFIARLGKFIFLKERHVQRAEQLFNKYGVWTIIIGRHIPGMRIPITVFAAVSGVRYRTFILSTLVSMLAWIWFYLSIGKHYGANLQQLLRHSTVFTAVIIGGIVTIVLVLHLYGTYRERKS